MATFLTVPDDYLTVMKAPIFTGLTADDATREPKAQSYAINTVIGYASTRYNINAMLQQSGDSRDATLVQYIVAISTFKLYNSVDQTAMPKRRREEYDDVIAFLKAIADGTMNMASIWPVVKDPDGQTETGVRAGGDEAHNQRY